MAGETNLMGFAELSNVEKLRRLFEAFTQQRDILHLLDQSLQAEGVQIFIGQESGYTILDDCSIVTAPYTLDQEVVGVLGRDRADAHGLRARDSDRRYHREAAGLRLEFAGLSRNSRPRLPQRRLRCGRPCRAEPDLIATDGERLEHDGAERARIRRQTARRLPATPEEAGATPARCRPRWPRPRHGAGEQGPVHARARRAGERPQAASRDVEQAHKYALDRFANDLIGVKDSLELGLASAGASADALRAGTEATLKLLAKAFEKAGPGRDRPAGRAVQSGVARGDGDAALRRARAEHGHCRSCRRAISSTAACCARRASSSPESRSNFNSLRA